jgi:hypothetical protein
MRTAFSNATTLPLLMRMRSQTFGRRVMAVHVDSSEICLRPLCQTSLQKQPRLSAVLHSLQANNEFLHSENEAYRAAVATKTKHKKLSKPLRLQQREEVRTEAVFWSPRKIRKARARGSQTTRRRAGTTPKKKREEGAERSCCRPQRKFRRRKQESAGRRQRR